MAASPSTNGPAISSYASVLTAPAHPVTITRQMQQQGPAPAPAPAPATAPAPAPAKRLGYG